MDDLELSFVRLGDTYLAWDQHSDDPGYYTDLCESGVNEITELWGEKKLDEFKIVISDKPDKDGVKLVIKEGKEIYEEILITKSERYWNYDDCYAYRTIKRPTGTFKKVKSGDRLMLDDEYSSSIMESIDHMDLKELFEAGKTYYITLEV